MVTQLECGNYLMFRDVKSEFCFPILLFYILYIFPYMVAVFGKTFFLKFLQKCSINII